MCEALRREGQVPARYRAIADARTMISSPGKDHRNPEEQLTVFMLAGGTTSQVICTIIPSSVAFSDLSLRCPFLQFPWPWCSPLPLRGGSFRQCEMPSGV